MAGDLPYVLLAVGAPPSLAGVSTASFGFSAKLAQPLMRARLIARCFGSAVERTGAQSCGSAAIVAGLCNRKRIATNLASAGVAEFLQAHDAATIGAYREALRR